MESQLTREELRRRAAELEARAQGPPPESWRPDKPELGHPNPLVGVLLRVKPGPDRGYGPTEIAQVQDMADTLWDVWLLGEILQQEFDQSVAASAKPGDLVSVHYEGLRQPKDPSRSPYRAYRVDVDRLAASSPSPAAAEEPTAPRPFAGVQPTLDDEVDFEGERAPPEAERVQCARCQFLDGHHAPGCPGDVDDIPF